MKTLSRAITPLLILIGCTQSTQRTDVKKPEAANPATLVNRYLAIMLVENKHGAGLAEVLAAGFSFEDPFTGRVDSAHQFIDNPQVQRWIDTPKSFHMQRQFVDGDHVCSTFSLDVVGLSGTPSRYDVVDVAEVRGNHIAKEVVYFANPVEFAKNMGFAAEYLKRFGL